MGRTLNELLEELAPKQLQAIPEGLQSAENVWTVITETRNAYREPARPVWTVLVELEETYQGVG
jgi:hypothetical protein